MVKSPLGVLILSNFSKKTKFQYLCAKFSVMVCCPAFTECMINQSKVIMAILWLDRHPSCIMMTLNLYCTTLYCNVLKCIVLLFESLVLYSYSPLHSCFKDVCIPHGLSFFYSFSASIESNICHRDKQFLAAMSRSRSDGVTQCVRTYVTLLWKRSYEANERYLSLPMNLQMTKDPWSQHHDPFPMTLTPWPLPHDPYLMTHTTRTMTHDLCVRLVGNW